jgi:hypothetical protein
MLDTGPYAIFHNTNVYCMIFNTTAVSAVHAFAKANQLKCHFYTINDTVS